MAQANVLIEQEEDTLTGKYLIFSMDKDHFGLEIRYITEIIGMRPITEVPEMPGYMLGVINNRGKILPIMEARRRFKRAPREYDEKACIIVIETSAISFGLLVDSVVEVLAIDDDDISPPPELKNNLKYMKGIGKVGDRVNLLLDCQELLLSEEIEILSAID